MNGNKYLFSNGLLLEWDGTNIALSMINKESKIEFAFYGVKFEATGGAGESVYKLDGVEVAINYFEGLKDRVEQPTNSKIEEGSKTYKAEKTGDVVGYKDKIEKDMFNFDKWEYSASYVNENGKTIQAIINGKSIKIVGLSKTNTQLKINVSGISEEGGDYTFVVDLNQNPAVTIIGGNESITSPDTPFDGGVITGGQEKIVNLGEIFEINAEESPVEIKNYEGNTDDGSLLQVLYDNLYLYYLVGKLDGYSSNVFKITKDENSGQNIISIIFTGAEEQEFTIVKDADGKFSLVDKEGNPVDGNFVLELNTDLYEFSAKIADEPEENGSTGENGNSPEGGTTPTNEGDSGSGESSAEGGEQPQPTTIKVLTITITPVFTYKYQVESNIKLIDIVDTDFAETGELKVVGKEITSESVVKLRFSVLRGKGADAKEVAFAYYSLSLKPSVGAVVSYPTISTSTKDENGNFVAVGQTTEYFYADAGEFDINAKSDISSGEAPRMVVTKYAYGTATVGEGKNAISYPCVATYLESHKDNNLTIIKIGDTDITDDKLVTTGNISTNEITAEVTFNKEMYSILLYKPSKLNISYTASSNQNIINKITIGENDGESYDASYTTKTKSIKGKFKFKFGTDVNVSEAEVVISAQATIGSYTYTFAQYTFTVCKNPVISTLITTEEGHLDGNGAEILPINGGDPLTPFNTARGYVEIDGTRYEVTKNGEQYKVDVGSESYPVKNGQITIGDGENAKIYKVVYYNIINNSPRLQFVYNNLILSDDYNESFTANDSTMVNFVVEQTKKDDEYHIVNFKYNGQSVSGEYKYKRVWDFDMNPTLDSHTIEGIFDPENPSELLNYYYLNAGKAYNIIETFGLTKYFSTESLTEIFDLGFADGETADGYEGVKFTADGKSINILGAPEGGMNFKIKFKPYKNAEFKTIGITILPSIEIVVNYRTETIYENDPYAYGLISYNQVKNNEAYPLISNAKGTDFTIRRNGVTADVVEGEYTLEIVEGTDETLNAKIEHSGSSATLTIANPPRLNAKRVVIKISDKYGYYQYLRYVVGAETQVVISSNDITFTTGGTIDWENNQFPISFKKSGEETIQLASFYTATISGATKENISDTYGDSSSLKVGADGKLYGVQLDSVVTKTTGTGESKTQTHYIPYVSDATISYDVYKLVAKDSDGKDVVLKSFDKYSKVEIYKGNSITADYTWIKGGQKPDKWPLDDKGALTPIKDVSQYTIKLFSSSSSSSADGIIQFILLEVNKTDNLYYASRENPTDHYTFAYNISIDGTDIVDVDGKTINNIGNAQYGSAQSLNTTLKITVTSNINNVKTDLDSIDIGILLKFGIYPEVKQTVAGQISYDYVGRGDKLTEVLKGAGIKLTGDSAPASLTPQYYTVLGDESSTLTSEPADKMTGGTLAVGSYSYDGNTRVLSLKAGLTSDTATINNIKYTYDSTDSTNKTLKIGYRVVPLTDGQFVDDVTGITYKVDGTQLLISKKIDNANTVTINNIKYTVETSGATPTVKYETLYESIFVVWEYDHDNNSETSPLIYWAQWNYKVVDKFNQVTTGDPLEAQDGNIKVKLDWVSGDYRFNANTLELFQGTTRLGTAQWVSELSGNRYEINIETTKDEQAITGRYKIVLNDGKMAFSFISGTVDEVITSLALTEEKTKNSSWADKITLTGLDGELTSLRVANGMTRDDKKLITINDGNNLEISGSSGLLSKTINVTITYKDSIEGVDKSLKFNGNDIKVTFEHFDPTKSNQQSA